MGCFTHFFFQVWLEIVACWMPRVSLFPRKFKGAELQQNTVH